VESRFGAGRGPAAMDPSGKKAVIAGAIGNVMEWYDFGLYGYFASIISVLFFPSKNPLTSLLVTFAVFGIGFVARPLGGFIFGHYGDKVGRKNALAVTMIMMGFATFLVGVLPTYQKMGALAPVLLTFIRLVQGFSAGGEWIGSTSFVVEYAPRTRRGFVGSWQMFGVGVGLLLGSGMGVLFSSSLGKAALYAWGWRIPFILGLVIALVGFYLRSRIEETPRFKEVASAHEVAKSPLIETLRKYPKQTLLTLGFTINWTVSYYVFLNYMPTYITKILHLPLSLTMISNTIGLIFFLILVPFTGALSDRIGRRPLLLASCVGFAVFTYPLFLLMNNGSFAVIVLVQMAFAFLEALFSGPGSAALAEMFPTRIRYSALSIGYNLAVVIFGGMAPFVSTYLIMATGSNMSPTYYVIGGAVVSLIAIVLIKDTYRESLS